MLFMKMASGKGMQTGSEAHWKVPQDKGDSTPSSFNTLRSATRGQVVSSTEVRFSPLSYTSSAQTQRCCLYTIKQACVTRNVQSVMEANNQIGRIVRHVKRF